MAVILQSRVSNFLIYAWLWCTTFLVIDNDIHFYYILTHINWIFTSYFIPVVSIAYILIMKIDNLLFQRHFKEKVKW